MAKKALTTTQWCEKWSKQPPWGNAYHSFIKNALKDGSDITDAQRMALHAMDGALDAGLIYWAIGEWLSWNTAGICQAYKNNPNPITKANLTERRQLAQCIQLKTYNDAAKCLQNDKGNWDLINKITLIGIIAAGVSDIALLWAFFEAIGGLEALAAWIENNSHWPSWIKNIVLSWINNVKNSLESKKDQAEQNLKELEQAIEKQNKLVGDIIKSGLDALESNIEKYATAQGKEIADGIERVAKSIGKGIQYVVSEWQHKQDVVAKAIEKSTKDQIKQQDEAINKIVGEMEKSNTSLIHTMGTAYETEYASANSMINAFIGIGLKPFKITDESTNKTSFKTIFDVTVKEMAEMMISEGDPIDNYFTRLSQAAMRVLLAARVPSAVAGAMNFFGHINTMKMNAATVQAMKAFDSKTYIKNQQKLMQANMQLKETMMAQLKKQYNDLKNQKLQKPVR